MDNLTHSLVGVIAAEAFTKVAKKDPPPKLPIYIASILGNNLPDLDFIWQGNLMPPLGPLLYHRGYTHVLLLTIPLAFLVFGLVYFIFRRNFKTHKRQIFFAGLIGLILHIAADSLNSYGVHPFYPFNNNWFYGDSVFIIEPLLWSVMAVYVSTLIKDMRFKRGLLLFLSIIPFIAFSMGFLKLYSLFFIFALGAMMMWLYKKYQYSKLSICISSVAILLAIFMTTSQAIKSQVRSEVEPLNTKVLEVAVSPFPANPFCYFFLTVEIEGDKSITRAGVASKYIEVTQCPQGMYNVSLNPSKAASTPHTFFAGETSFILSDFKKRKEEDCFFEAWLKFARIPTFEWNRAFDLRFSRVGNYNFSEIYLATIPEKSCTGYVPAWNYPRADLLAE